MIRPRAAALCAPTKFGCRWRRHGHAPGKKLLLGSLKSPGRVRPNKIKIKTPLHGSLFELEDSPSSTSSSAVSGLYRWSWHASEERRDTSSSSSSSE